MKKFNNNKGFSLVELLVAVAVMTVLALPILQMFTLSTRITARSKSIGEATAAAQNVLETMQVRGLNNFMGKSGVNMSDHLALKMLGENEIDSSNTRVEGNTISIKGVSSGSNTFDTKIYFDPDGRSFDEDGNLAEISGKDVMRSFGLTVNNKLIAQYTDMSGTYSQAFSPSQNPDEIMKKEFESLYPGESYDTRTRTVNIDVTSEPDEENGSGYLVYVDITFSYSVTPRPRGYTDITVTFNVFPAGKHIDSYDEEVSCFIMYFPFYENSVIENFNIYVDRNNDDSDLKFKAFIIKQVPWIVRADGSLVNALDPAAGIAGSVVLSKDRTYRMRINEYHNRKFVLPDSSDQLTDEHMNVYTNCNRQLADQTRFITNPITYRIRKNVGSGYLTFSVESLERNTLVKTTAEDRFYNVTIEIYPSGTLDFDEDHSNEEETETQPLFTLEAGKLK